MIKKISKLLLYILVLIILLATYFSFFGLETKRFNELIKKKIIESTVVTNIELNNIKLTLKLLDLSINIKTIDPKVFINSKKIELNEIRTNLSIRSFLNQKFSISFLDISVKETKIKDILSAQRAYKDNAKLFILEKLIEDGYLVADIRLNFDTFGTIKDNFEINGHLKKSKLKLFNKKK